MASVVSWYLFWVIEGVGHSIVAVGSHLVLCIRYYPRATTPRESNEGIGPLFIRLSQLPFV